MAEMESKNKFVIFVDKIGLFDFIFYDEF